jgi:hypothetical protein
VTCTSIKTAMNSECTARQIDWVLRIRADALSARVRSEIPQTRKSEIPTLSERIWSFSLRWSTDHGAWVTISVSHRVRIPFRPTTRHSQTCGILSKPSHATDPHSWPHAHLRGLLSLRPLRPLPERLPHLPPVESRSRFTPRPHPPDDPRLSERAL